MKIIAVYPIPEDLIHLSLEIRRITPPGTSVECFCDPLYALQYAFHHAIDALYTAAHMSRLPGLDLAQILQARYPEIHVYILWQDDTFRRAAQRIRADGYLLTPVTADALRRAEEEAEERRDFPAANFEKRSEQFFERFQPNMAAQRLYFLPNLRPGQRTSASGEK